MIPNWYPEHPPIYDIEKTYLENAEYGPFFEGKIPSRKSSDQRFDFLGFEVGSRIGVPAGPLLNSKWIALAARLGFDILTYKTIRSEAHPSHRLPNVSFIDDRGHRVKDPRKMDALTITNSFGMPSMSPDFLLQDLEKANQSLSKGQVMVVSVAGTPNRGVHFSDDFARTAAMAREGGANIIEANFSCPNIERAKGILYQSAETVHSYTQRICRAIGPVPLILKVGVFPDRKTMEQVFVAAARGGARGICGINSVSMPIHPPLDAERTTSGVCGHAIRPAALQFIREGSEIIREHGLGLALIGCGGILLAEHFNQFLEAGADAAMAATGIMWDPYLALRYHEHSSAHS